MWSLIKGLILRVWFIKDALKEAERQGGIKAFPLAQKDILETMRDDLDKQAVEIAKQKLGDLLSPVDLQKIVTLDKTNKICYIGAERADEGRLANLKAEAEFLTKSDLWGLLHETPKELAQRAMFVEGGLENLQKGRSILYTLSTQQNIIEVFRSFQAK